MALAPSDDTRLAELLAVLSLATDLGSAFPLEKALRNALLAAGLAHELGLSADEQSDTYYLGMLRFLGCSAFAHELAAAFGGDDNAFHSTFEPVDITRPTELLSQALLHLGQGRPPLQRAAAVARFLSSGARIAEQMRVADCEAADRLAQRLGLSEGVRLGLAHVWTRWDGKGSPPLSGEAISRPARVVLLANQVEIFSRMAGRDVAADVVRRRSGSHLDPTVAAVFLRNPEPLLASLEAESIWTAALAAEPEPWQRLPTRRIDELAQAFAEFADLKSPYTLGHSSGVAGLAGAGARCLGLSEAEASLCRRAGWLHDLGRLSVPNGIWDKAGRLTPAEWERVRLHPYYSERVLAQSDALRPLAQLAGMHHERRDGSGYHRALGAAGLPAAARLIGAADAYQAMTEVRPYRPALAPAVATEQLRAGAREGQLDAESVEAVLEAAGQVRRRARRVWPAGLSDREVEVLRLVARGNSDKQIGGVLVISDVTVHHHVQHIYNKIGVSTRAGAALFAMEHDLLQ